MSTFIRKKCSLVHDIEKKRQEKLKSAINDQNRSRVCKTKLNGMNNRNFTEEKKNREDLNDDKDDGDGDGQNSRGRVCSW